MEAMFAAVSFDADFSAAEKVVRHLFAERVKRADLNIGKKDSKTALQEALQARRFALPKYRIEEQAEQTADAMFVISVIWANSVSSAMHAAAVGKWPSKKRHVKL